MLHDKPSEIQQGIQDKLHGMRCTQPPKNKSENNPWTHTATSSQPTSKALSTNAAGRCNFSFTARTKKSAAHWGSCGGTNSAFKKAKADMSSRVGPSAMLATDSTLATCKEIPAFASSSHSLPTHMWDSGPPPPPFKMAGECNCCLQMPTKQLLLVCGQKCPKQARTLATPETGSGDHLCQAINSIRRTVSSVCRSPAASDQVTTCRLQAPGHVRTEAGARSRYCRNINKPWALVRKYLRLAPSMMTAAQFLEGCHPYTCAASV